MLNHNQRLLSKALFEQRKKSKLTQKTLADIMGISVAMYSKIELGERSVQETQIPKLARCLNIDITEIRTLCLADKLSSEVNNYPREIVGKALNIIYDNYNQQQ